MVRKLPLLINVRGNSGSGKSTLAREFLKLGNRLHDRHHIDRDNRFIFEDQHWVILGKYSNVCGGCDTIKTQQEIVDRVEEYTSKGSNVFLEGLIMSTIYGTVGAYSEKFGPRWVFAYLDTPLDVCLKRVYARRAAAGNVKPFNETNTRNRAATIVRNREIVLSHNRRVVDLPYQNALAPLLKIIRKEG